MKKRKPNWTQEETLHLVSRIQERKYVINGRFEPTLTNKDKKKAWEEIAISLNAAHPLRHRTVDEVETKWFSVLSKSRKKVSAIRREYCQSGESLLFYIFIIITHNLSYKPKNVGYLILYISLVSIMKKLNCCVPLNHTLVPTLFITIDFIQ